MSLFSLDNKVVLVTGGYGHLGAAICRGMAEAGALVVALGRSEEKFQEALGDSGVRFKPCDVASAESVRAVLGEIAGEHGGIDVLVNNAFYVRGDDPLAISDDDWAFTMDGCLGSVYRCIREAAPFLREGVPGSIINIGSMYGLVSPDFDAYENAPEFLNPPHYGAAKAGVVQLTKYFARLLGPEGIRVNCLSPGPFPNSAVQGNKGFVGELEKRTALGRIGQPQELIGAAVFLASGAASYITGHNLVVDGGWTIS